MTIPRPAAAFAGLCAAACLTGAATAQTAGPYDGTYKQAANAECALVGVDGGAVRIADGIFYGVEVECLMADPVNVIDMDALLYTMQCSGGDQIFSERAMLMNKAQDDGIIMIWDGYAFVYDRCTDTGTPVVKVPENNVVAPDDDSPDDATTDDTTTDDMATDDTATDDALSDDGETPATEPPAAGVVTDSTTP